MIVEACAKGEYPIVFPVWVVNECQARGHGEFLGRVGPIVESKSGVEHEVRHAVSVNFPKVLDKSSEAKSVKCVCGGKDVVVVKGKDAGRIVKPNGFARHGRDVWQGVS